MNLVSEEDIINLALLLSKELRCILIKNKKPHKGYMTYISHLYLKNTDGIEQDNIDKLISIKNL